MTTSGIFSELVGSSKIFEVKVPSFEDIYLKKTDPGQPIRDALTRHTTDVLSFFNTINEIIGARNVVILDVPRGGVPSAQAAFNFMSENTRPKSLVHISSNIKSTPHRLFPQTIDLSEIDTLVIVDAVVATGKTIIDHIKQLPDNFTGQVMLLSNATAQKGAHAFSQVLNEKGITGFHLTGGIIPDDKCVMKVIDGKDVYIVGLGDIGEAVSVDLPSTKTSKNVACPS